MTVEEFQKAFGKEIKEILARIRQRYSVSEDDFACALHSSAKKYLPDVMGQASTNPAPTAEARKAALGYFDSLNCDDLCLAVACAKGDEAAWEDFYRDYRGYMVNIARTMTQDAGAAEQLADSTFAELYGLRESSGSRVSKFSFYSGRGSLRGWLRAVVFQLSADHHRQTSRLVQTEEPEDMDRLVLAADAGDRHAAPEVSFVNERYRSAISDALRRAISELESRERLLLAYYYYDEMTLREIGRLFDVHEATISRWLTKIQKRLRKLVEKGLAHEHHFNRREVSEAIELAAQQMDINVREYLFESASSDHDQDRTAKSAGGAVAPR
ncbi:MAG TPA: sigma-70 family RNA polymerase sigma factor [Blastocatellia bacterium]|jgi:RNA polymerase sigma-70 factor|nr:sigma-70 family RNA polymerase sigma factor [Blastocatellia bacterium]